MITFWGDVALTTMAAYAGNLLVNQQVAKSKRTIKQAEQDHGLHDSNRDRAINSLHGWR